MAGLVTYSPGARRASLVDDAVYVVTAKALSRNRGRVSLLSTFLARLPRRVTPVVATNYFSLVWRIVPDFRRRFADEISDPVFLVLQPTICSVLSIRVARFQMSLSAVVATATIGSSHRASFLSPFLMSEPLALALSAAHTFIKQRLLVMRVARRTVSWRVCVRLGVWRRSAAMVLLSMVVGLQWREPAALAVIAVAISLALMVQWFVWSSAHAHSSHRPWPDHYGPWRITAGRYRAEFKWPLIMRRELHRWTDVHRVSRTVQCVSRFARAGFSHTNLAR